MLSEKNLGFLNHHYNRGMGVTEAQYIDATMVFMEKSGVYNIRFFEFQVCMSTSTVDIDRRPIFFCMNRPTWPISTSFWVL